MIKACIRFSLGGRYKLPCEGHPSTSPAGDRQSRTSRVRARLGRLLSVNHQYVVPIGVCNKPGGIRTGLDRTAYQVEMIANKISRQPVPGHGHGGVSCPAVTLRIECFDCRICAPDIAMPYFATRDINVPRVYSPGRRTAWGGHRRPQLPLIRCWVVLLDQIDIECVRDENRSYPPAQDIYAVAYCSPCGMISGGRHICGLCPGIGRQFINLVRSHGDVPRGMNPFLLESRV